MERLARLFLLLSIVLLLVTVVLIFREREASWRPFQESYRANLTARAKTVDDQEAASHFTIGIRQDWLPELKRADRCRTCHIGVDDPDSPKSQPLAPHPDIAPHTFDRFGCTICHGGEGYATRLPDAHEQLLPMRLIESSCGKCHGLAGPGKEKAPTLDAGAQLVEAKRCFGCHILVGKDKSPPPAPPLDGLATKVNRKWLGGWLHNPKEYLPQARMADFLLTTRETEALEDYLLSLPMSAEKQDEFYRESESDRQWLATLSEDEHDALVDRGKEVFGRSRCLSCHVLEGKGGTMGPDLSRISIKSNRRWLDAWLRDPAIYDPRTAMPTFRLNREERLGIVEYLLWESELNSEDANGEPDSGDLDPAPGEPAPKSTFPAGDLREEGGRLFLTKGCYNCHELPGVKGRVDFAPSLADLADRQLSRIDFGKSVVPRTLPDYIVGKLQNPRIYGEKLKMPFFGLEPAEVGRLATTLLGRSQEVPDSYRDKKVVVPLPEPTGEVGRIFERYRCFSCHRLGDKGGSLAPDLTFEGSKVEGKWLKSFLQKPYAIRPALAERMPRFNLTEAEATTLADYARLLLRSDRIDAAASTNPGEIESGRKLYFETYNCQTCHSIDGQGGYFGPALERVGFRLTPAWLITRLDNAHPYEPGAREPVLAIPPEQRRQLLAFLLTLKKEEKK